MDSFPVKMHQLGFTTSFFTGIATMVAGIVDNYFTRIENNRGLNREARVNVISCIKCAAVCNLMPGCTVINFRLLSADYSCQMFSGGGRCVENIKTKKEEKNMMKRGVCILYCYVASETATLVDSMALHRNR
jgi:hypothetical protein